MRVLTRGSGPVSVASMVMIQVSVHVVGCPAVSLPGSPEMVASQTPIASVRGAGVGSGVLGPGPSLQARTMPAAAAAVTKGLMSRPPRAGPGLVYGHDV